MPIQAGPRYGYPRLSRYSARLSVYAQLVKPFTVFSAFIASLLLASYVGPLPHALLFALMMAAAQALGQAVNQIADVDIDRINKPWRPLPSGKITEEQAWAFAYAIHVTGLLFSLILYGVTGNAVPVAVYAVAENLALMYSIEPVRAKARGAWFSLLWQAVARGLYPPLAAAAVFGYSQTLLALSVVAFLWVLALQATKDFGDVKGDAMYGIDTLPVRYGLMGARRVMAVMLAAYTFAVSVAVGVGLLSPLFLVLPALGVVALRLIDVESPTENNLAWNLYYVGLGLHYLLLHLG